MTEQELPTCNDPQVVLEFLRQKVSQRKLRLLAVACCRGLWQWMTDERSRKGVDVAERYADRLASDDELTIARQGTGTAWTTVWSDWPHIYQAARTAHFACCVGVDRFRFVLEDAKNATMNYARSTGGHRDVDKDIVAEITRQLSLIHCIFGNPFRDSQFHDSWRTATVLSLAQAIYTEKSFDRLPIVADSLLDAGCTDQAILDHCRSAGPHVRGCWVVDLVLGKQ